MWEWRRAWKWSCAGRKSIGAVTCRVWTRLCCEKHSMSSARLLRARKRMSRVRPYYGSNAIFNKGHGWIIFNVRVSNALFSPRSTTYCIHILYHVCTTKSELEATFTRSKNSTSCFFYFLHGEKNLIIIVSWALSIKAPNLICEISMDFYHYWHEVMYF